MLGCHHLVHETACWEYTGSQCAPKSVYSGAAQDRGRAKDGTARGWECETNRHCNVCSSQLRTATALSINTTSAQCNLNRGPLTGLAFWFHFLVIPKAWHFKNHLLAKHTTRLTPPPSLSKTLIYLLNFKHVSTSVVVTRTSGALALSRAIFAEQGHSVNNCTGDAASRMYDRVLHVFMRR